MTACTPYLDKTKTQAFTTRFPFNIHTCSSQNAWVRDVSPSYVYTILSSRTEESFGAHLRLGYKISEGVHGGESDDKPDYTEIRRGCKGFRHANKLENLRDVSVLHILLGVIGKGRRPVDDNIVYWPRTCVAALAVGTVETSSGPLASMCFSKNFTPPSKSKLSFSLTLGYRATSTFQELIVPV